MKKTLQEEKDRFYQIVKQNEQSNSSKYHDTLKDIANSGYNETENDNFSGEHTNVWNKLPRDFRTKNVFTKDDLKLIIKLIEQNTDEMTNYRLYDLERFLGIFEED